MKCLGRKACHLTGTLTNEANYDNICFSITRHHTKEHGFTNSRPSNNTNSLTSTNRQKAIDYPHPNIKLGDGSWRWEGEASEGFVGMHGDEFDEDDDEEDEGEEGGEGVEQFTPFESDDFSVLPCPSPYLMSIRSSYDMVCLLCS